VNCWLRWAVAICEGAQGSTEEEMNEELLGALSQLIEIRFSGLTKPIRKNLVVLTFAFILVLSAVRSVCL